MTKINLTIDLDEDFGDYNEDGELVMSGTMSDLIRDRVVETTVQRLLGSNQSKLREKIEDEVERRVGREVKAAVSAILSGPIQRTDPWGTAKGEPTSIAELTQEAAAKYLTAPPSDRSYNNRGPGNLGELVQEIVKEALAKDLKPAVDAARKQVQTAIIDQALAGAVAAIAPKVPTR